MFMSFELPISYDLPISNDISHYFAIFRENIISFLTWSTIIGITAALIFVILFTLVFIIASYYFYTYFTSITRENLEFFNTDYNKVSKETLEKYGSNKITKAFLVKKPISSFVHSILSIFSLYKWDVNANKDLYHASIVLETVDKTGNIKYIRVEKTHSIRITPNFKMKDAHTILPIKLNKKKTFTIQSIMDKIRHKMGDNKFFNFNIKNHCQFLSSNIIKIIHADKNTPMKKYQVTELPFSDLSFYLMNWCIFFGSFIF